MGRIRTNVVFFATGVALVGWILRGFRPREAADFEGAPALGKGDPDCFDLAPIDAPPGKTPPRPLAKPPHQSPHPTTASPTTSETRPLPLDVAALTRKELFDVANARGVPATDLILMTKSEIAHRLRQESEAGS
ncbi:MAG: hypothetical protein ACRD3Q_19120 [Terriglobales bacterium]